ncbi:MAG: hypothetical protein EAZ60_11920 [Oscillatoriales cyanobacterium]|nr:MAG: hypothetical protein EAZ83_01710 [Oscillatoriales cyanobacterium]TAF23408.1 MAG: hypothetical protein EAZ73_02050 [Oscillatoriales cyanobacterium]TAF30444.1 MAG: hypothetical protein EAZ69_22510 [Oscillatoriales cyanobacterium]TAF55792.1 MAG: hypothetical protein EAZ60_11920 [Oscillatoriales cyanobacterium]
MTCWQQEQAKGTKLIICTLRTGKELTTSAGVAEILLTSFSNRFLQQSKQYSKDLARETRN